MKNKIILFIVAVLVVSGTLVYLSYKKNIEIQKVETPWVNMKADLVAVEGISGGQKISSPISIRGSARGYWFFEASFPIEIQDENGNVLGGSIATAEGEWMTEEFVPFSAEVEFTPNGATKGYIVLIKDNPSGEAQFDDELRIPVTF